MNTYELGICNCCLGNDQGESSDLCNNCGECDSCCNCYMLDSLESRNNDVLTPGQALIEWVTYDLGETENTQQELMDLLYGIQDRKFSSIEELYASWESLVETWNREEV